MKRNEIKRLKAEIAALNEQADQLILLVQKSEADTAQQKERANKAEAEVKTWRERCTFLSKSRSLLMSRLEFMRKRVGHLTHAIYEMAKACAPPDDHTHHEHYNHEQHYVGGLPGLERES